MFSVAIPVPDTIEAVTLVRHVLELPAPLTLSPAWALLGLDTYHKNWLACFRADVDPLVISFACCGFGWLGRLPALGVEHVACTFCGHDHSTSILAPTCAIAECPRACLGPHAHSACACCRGIRLRAAAPPPPPSSSGGGRGAAAGRGRLPRADPFAKVG